MVCLCTEVRCNRVVVLHRYPNVCYLLIWWCKTGSLQDACSILRVDFQYQKLLKCMSFLKAGKDRSIDSPSLHFEHLEVLTILL